MRVFYSLADYVSHRRAGQENILALRGAGHEIVDDPASAHVAVLHDEPPYLERHLQRLGGVRLPVAAYCVFEAAPLPEAFAAPLSVADEIWTCSQHSRSLFAERHPAVHVVPHVVRRPEPSAADLERVRAMLGCGERFWFYSIADAANRRKNLAAALSAFRSLRAELGERAGSVGFAVKQYRHSLDFSAMQGVVSLEGDFTDGEMAALHALGHCYLSPHRAEAWGLGLSEAMALGNRVVATGWSGNMAFMDERNSRPLPYRLTPVTDEDLAGLPPFFRAGMLWAEPDQPVLLSEMRRALRGADPDMAARARGICERFSPKRVGRIMGARLAALAGG